MPTKPILGGHKEKEALDEVDSAFAGIEREVRDSLAGASLNPLNWLQAAGRVLGHTTKGQRAARELRAIHEQNKSKGG